jgi:hypothetical protein
MFAAYLLGCAIGSWLRSRVVLRQAASAGSAEHPNVLE